VPDLKQMIWDLRGENVTVECARCGKQIGIELAEPEEGGEWECRPCNIRCNEQERKALQSEGDTK